jgi:hypothetical protein
MGNIYHSVHFFTVFLSLSHSLYLSTHSIVSNSSETFTPTNPSTALKIYFYCLCFSRFSLLYFNLQKHFPFFFPTTISQLIVLYDWKIFLLDTIDGTLETDTETWNESTTKRDRISFLFFCVLCIYFSNDFDWRRKCSKCSQTIKKYTS